MLMDKRLSTLCIKEGETEEALSKLAASARFVCACQFIFRDEKCFHSFHGSVDVTHIFQKRAPFKEKPQNPFLLCLFI